MYTVPITRNSRIYSAEHKVNIESLSIWPERNSWRKSLSKIVLREGGWEREKYVNYFYKRVIDRIHCSTTNIINTSYICIYTINSSVEVSDNIQVIFLFYGNIFSAYIWHIRSANRYWFFHQLCIEERVKALLALLRQKIFSIIANIGVN